jgi:ATP dependent DNA ligase domain/Transposase DDE domain
MCVKATTLDPPAPPSRAKSRTVLRPGHLLAKEAKAILEVENLDAVADRGYFNSEEILACEEAGITVTLPKPMTSNAKAEGRFGKQDFRYVAEQDVYICPAGERLAYSFTTEDKGLVLHRYATKACQNCAIKNACTTAKQRLISRWEHEHVLEAVQRRLDEHPEKMRQRRETVEHPFGTIKAWMGATHFLMKTLPKVATEMALHCELKRRVKRFEPCLPRPAKEPPAGPNWIHEIKHDGFRIVAHRDGDRVRLVTRNGFDFADRFPLVAEAIAALPVRSCVLDGEAIAVDDNGLSVFDLIRYRQHDHAVTLCAFDLLELDGEDLRRTPIELRKATLKGLLRRSHSGVAFNQHFEADGDAVYRHACALGCEGIVSKRLGSPYRGDRTDHWLKVKNPKAPAVSGRRKRSGVNE